MKETGGSAVRPWTEAEQQRLFDDYLGTSPGVCPVCGDEVGMVMSCLAERVKLLLTCQGCGNKASVARALSEFRTAYVETARANRLAF